MATELRLPRHIGPNIFPFFPLFPRLLGYAARETAIVIKDIQNNYEASHIQLLTDALHVRNVLLETLDEVVKRQLWAGEEVFINLLTPAGYEFAVGFLAIIAVGGIIVPLGTYRLHLIVASLTKNNSTQSTCQGSNILCEHVTRCCSVDCNEMC